MDVIVALKQVPDLATGIELDEQGTGLARDRLGFVTSPFDEWALEEALLLKEVAGGTVAVVALDEPDVDQSLYRALALGADRAVKLAGAGGVDSHGRARVVASWIRTQPYELVLSGVQAPDDLDGQLTPLLGALLGHPYALVVVGVEPGEGSLVVTQELGGGRLGRLELPLPAVLGIQVSLRDPRYVSDMRIRLAAMGGGVEVVPVEPPAPEAGLTVRRMSTPEASRRAEMLPGSADDAAAAILGLLRARGLIP